MREVIEDILEEARSLHEGKSPEGRPWKRTHELAHDPVYQVGYLDGYMDQLEWTIQALEDALSE